MPHVDIDDIDHPPTISPVDVVRPPSDRLETTGVAVNAFELAPGEFQLGRNAGEKRVRVLAIGAPGKITEIEYLRACGRCSEETIQTPDVDRKANVIEIRCKECGSVVDRFEFDQ